MNTKITRRGFRTRNYRGELPPAAVRERAEEILAEWKLDRPERLLAELRPATY